MSFVRKIKEEYDIRHNKSREEWTEIDEENEVNFERDIQQAYVLDEERNVEESEQYTNKELQTFQEQQDKLLEEQASSFQLEKAIKTYNKLRDMFKISIKKECEKNGEDWYERDENEHQYFQHITTDIDSQDPHQVDKVVNYVEYMKKTIEKNKEKKEKEEQLTDEQLQQIKTKAKVESNVYNIKNKFIENFSEYSFMNEGIGEIMFHSILGTCFKDTKIYKNSSLLNLNIHLIGIQDSGSGKDIAIDFLENFVGDINIFTDKYNHTLDKNNKITPIFIHNISGNETPQALLDSFPQHETKPGYKLVYEKKDFWPNNKTEEVLEKMHEIGKKLWKEGLRPGDDIKPIPGLLSRSDILISRECSHIFRGAYNSSQGKGNDKIEVLLQTLEGRPYEKTLVGWQGRSTITHFTGSFIGMSRPIENMKSHIAYSGLQQRALNFMRKLTINIRQKMLEKVNRADLHSEEEEKIIEKERRELAEQFLLMRRYATKNKFIVKLDDRNKIVVLRNKILLQLFSEVIDNIMSDEHRGIIESFIARYPQHLQTLSYHYALIRNFHENVTNQPFIILSDVQNAISTVKQFHKGICIWIEGNIIEDKEKTNRRKEIISIIRKAIHRYVKIEKKEYIPKKYLTEEMLKNNISSSMAHIHLTKLSEGKYDLLERVKKQGTNSVFYKLRNIVLEGD